MLPHEFVLCGCVFSFLFVRSMILAFLVGVVVRLFCAGIFSGFS